MDITIIMFNNGSEKVFDVNTDYNDKCEILNELTEDGRSLLITQIVYAHVSSLGMKTIKYVDCKNIPYEEILYDYI